jgi:predicted HTH domain antitoxin
MKQVTLTYPDDLADELVQRLPLMAALKLFELGEISSGKAAALAGISRVEFLDACGKYKVSIFNYPDDEIEAELQRDLEALRSIRP